MVSVFVAKFKIPLYVHKYIQIQKLEVKLDFFKMTQFGVYVNQYTTSKILLRLKADGQRRFLFPTLMNDLYEAYFQKPLSALE